MSRVTWEKAQRITLRNVMQMSSGLEYKHDPTGNAIYWAADRFATALEPNLVAPPGTRFQYSDGDVSLTGAVVASASGRSLYGFAQTALFDKLQMANHFWAFVDGAGRFPGGWGLRLRPMDMAKLGQLYLQNGEWNGGRIFGPAYRDLAWTPGISRLYGLHWWIGNAQEGKGVAYFVASGFKGQKIYVFPSLGIVAAMTASLPGLEETKANGLIVAALLAAAKSSHGGDEGMAQASLNELEKRGFRGITRIGQEAQDTPRR